MKRNQTNHFRLSGLAKVSAIVITGCALLPPSPAQAQAGNQKYYDTPEAAVEALLNAFKTNNEQALLDIFGHEHDKLIVVTDKAQRGEAVLDLYNKAQQTWNLRQDSGDMHTLIIGPDKWPFPIPLIKETGGWRFDTDAGEDEIINRRVGQGELNAIETCQAYVDAQVNYAAVDRDGDQVREYAQKLDSTPGNNDGLYWKSNTTAGEEMSPFGPMLADAAGYLKARDNSKAPILPYEGYYFKILTGQGENVPGGKYDYIINGNMIAGFAMVACPADYGSSGVMTFLVSHHGQIFEKDLGDKTHDIAKIMKDYNPDSSWKLVDESGF